jgi:hypothetical protein
MRNGSKTPNAKHQTPKNHQVLLVVFGVWCLVFGVFLELGAWNLEFIYG